MERRKGSTEPKPDGKIWYKKVGGGSMHLKIDGKRRIIKPGEKFLINPNDVPKAFLDLVIPLESIPETKQEEVKAKPLVYLLKPSDKEGEEELFYIVNVSGKQINEKALDKQTAEKLIEDLAR